MNKGRRIEDIEKDIRKKIYDIKSSIEKYELEILHSLSINSIPYLDEIDNAIKGINESIAPYHFLKRNYILEGLNSFIQEVEREMDEYQKKGERETIMVPCENDVIAKYISHVFGESRKSMLSESIYYGLKNDKEIHQLCKGNRKLEETYGNIRNVMKSFIEKKKEEGILVGFGEGKVYPCYYKLICGFRPKSEE